jgi:hypothetical protein
LLMDGLSSRLSTTTMAEEVVASYTGMEDKRQAIDDRP